jgi:hypothetical protein
MDRLNQHPGPRAAADQFLLEKSGLMFERDRSFEYFLYSQHSGGFLRRKED